VKGGGMRIIPAAKHNFNDTAVFDDAKIGDVFKIDSGLGGSHSVVFGGKTEDGKYVFHRPARDDWPARTFRFNPDNVLSEVYILLPECSVELEWNTEKTEINGKQYVVEKACGVVWVEQIGSAIP
jgi:hypothetical protein